MRFILNQEWKSRRSYLLRFGQKRVIEVPASRVERMMETVGGWEQGVVPAELRCYRIWRSDGSFVECDPADMWVVER